MTTTIDGVDYYTEEELEEQYEKECEAGKSEWMESYYLSLEVDGETLYGKEG